MSPIGMCQQCGVWEPLEGGIGECRMGAPRPGLNAFSRPDGLTVAWPFAWLGDRLVAAFLTKYYGQGSRDQSPTDPLHTIPTKARFGLVTVAVAGESYVIADIGMRMLRPRELFRAQGFPDTYRIEQDADGKRFTLTEQTHCCGNSVSPPVAAALVAANVPDLARSKTQEAAFA